MSAKNLLASNATPPPQMMLDGSYQRFISMLPGAAAAGQDHMNQY